MASMAIYWNRNYCVTFLDQMVSCCGWRDNILAANHMILLTCTEMVGRGSYVGNFAALVLVPAAMDSWEDPRACSSTVWAYFDG